MKTFRGLFQIAVMLSLLLAFSLPGNPQTDIYDFAISEAFLKQLASAGTIQPVLRLRLEARTRRVHTLASDCEMHIAATVEDLELGWPSAIVVEPPNLCKFAPVGTSTNVSEKKLREKIWPELFDEKVMNKTCDVKGFPRIFTEHAQGAADPANPNHVFEIHPALSIVCDGEEVSFASFLTVFPGMRAVKPQTAASCLQNRQLEVRYADGRYVFREEGGQCGNFAVVEVGNLNRDWIRQIDGGHSAIARVSADGRSRTTLKIYTVSGSEADKWVAEVKEQGTGSSRKLLHGMLTYDYYSIVKAVRSTSGEWLKPDQWKRVEFPLALVVFGEAETAPWEEE